MAVVAVRLPVLGMVGRAFEDVWASLGGVARMAWPWYAAALAPTLAGEVAASYGAGSALWDVAAGLAGGAAVLACSARWQRHLIMGNRCAGRRGSTATSAATPPRCCGS